MLEPAAPLTAVPASATAKAELSVELPGMKALCERLAPLAIAARGSSAVAKLSRLELGRQICLFGQSAEVRAILARLNLRPDGGRPKSGHRYLVDALVKTTGLTERTFRRFIAEWSEFGQQLGLTLDEGQNVYVHAEQLPGKFCPKPPDLSTPDGRLALADWLDSVLHQEGDVSTAGAGGAGKSEPDPDKEAYEVKARLAAIETGWLFDNNGDLKANKKVHNAVLSWARQVCKKLGYEVVPVQGR